ncbi:MAG TPA: dipeptidase [Pyrinomonadaceae bacterium]|nr:dipeptidase [Pyrinomonadaceae bacterium]
MKAIFSLAILNILSFAAMGQTMPKDADPALWARALKLHRSAIIVDGHNDITGPMMDMDFNLADDSTGRLQISGDPMHTDLRRLKASGITGEFMSIYVSGSTMRTGGSMRRAMDLIDATYREAERHNDLVMCTTAAEIRRAKKQNKICLLMGIEGGYAIENSLHAMRNFYRLGVRYMTLTHNVTHDWADAHGDEKRNNGLSDFGKEVVREMNRLGMLIDISHVSDKVMHDALDISKAPIIASHSGSRGVSNHTRNVPDDVLKRLPQNGGVIMVVFYPGFLSDRTAREISERSDRLRDQIAQLRERYKDDQAAFVKAENELMAANPIYLADYKSIVDHIDHIKKVAGIDHAGIGSDYDGVPFLPPPMKGAEDLVLVTYEMLRRGYTEQEVRKVLGENFLRAMERAERVAGSRQISGQGSLTKLKK